MLFKDVLCTVKIKITSEFRQDGFIEFPLPLSNRKVVVKLGEMPLIEKYEYIIETSGEVSRVIFSNSFFDLARDGETIQIEF